MRGRFSLLTELSTKRGRETHEQGGDADRQDDHADDEDAGTLPCVEQEDAGHGDDEPEHGARDRHEPEQRIGVSSVHGAETSV